MKFFKRKEEIPKPIMDESLEKELEIKKNQSIVKNFIEYGERPEGVYPIDIDRIIRNELTDNELRESLQGVSSNRLDDYIEKVTHNENLSLNLSGTTFGDTFERFDNDHSKDKALREKLERCLPQNKNKSNKLTF